MSFGIYDTQKSKIHLITYHSSQFGYYKSFRSYVPGILDEDQNLLLTIYHKITDAYCNIQNKKIQTGVTKELVDIKRKTGK